jgi:hypothetical protein
MRTSKSWRNQRNQPIPAEGPLRLMAGTTILTSAALFFLTPQLPSPLVLPLLSTVMLLGAAAVSLVAWRSPHIRSAAPSYWDVSGALVFAGIGAALLSDPEAALPFFESGWPTEKTKN